MLTPTQSNESFDDPSSFNFNGLLNTINAGAAIPVVYGEVFTGSIIVSAGIDTEDFLRRNIMFKIPGVDVGAGPKEIFGFLGGLEVVVVLLP